MRKGLLGTIAALAASAGLAFAQPPAPTPSPMSPIAPTGPGAYAGLPMASGNLPYGDGPPTPPGLLTGYLGGDFSGNSGLDSERGWLNGDFITLFIRTMPAQPLITAGTTISGGTQPSIGTTTLFGAENFNVNPLLGGAVEQGVWFKRNPLWGFSWGGFVTEQSVDAFRIRAGDQVVARPFIDADTGLPNSLLVAFPGFLRGNIAAAVRSQLWGLEWNFHRKLLADPTRRITVLAGFRYLDIHEDLSVSSQSTVLPGNTISFYNLIFGPDAQINVNDSFDTRNQYMVGQLGFQGDWRYRRWLITFGTKFGIGGVYQSLDITGNSAVIPAPGAGANTVLGGLLAVDSNIGHSNSGRFAFIPEGKLQVVYRFCGCMDLGLGYTFTYISQIIRPSEQIDQQVSTTRVPESATFGFPAGALRPRVAYNESDMWIQGLKFTVSFRY